MKLFSMTTLTGVLLSSSVFAGGLDRIYLPIAYMFEDGHYIEFEITHVKSDVTGSVVKESIIKPYTPMALSYKLDLNEKIALGLSVYNSIGADTFIPNADDDNIEYAKISAFTTSVILKYKFTDDFSAYAGLKTLSASGGFGMGSTKSDMARTQGFGGIIGGAYERREIALRVALTYETKIELEMDTKRNGKTVPGVITKAGSAETFTLDFQTGIAKNTLVFGQIRHAKWGNANVLLFGDFGSYSLSRLTDVTSYELGIGRKLSEKLSMSVALGYEAVPDTFVYSLFPPTNGRKAITIGAEYQATDRMKISAGIRYTKFGNVANSGIRYSDNESIAVGLKIGFSL